ncbi:hypothetical protein NDU88_007276 [Pleurodeles waltl]|uniref:Uncharacterized protein n=1 Tax=Pleurodeles waltl TaxID=8319 RepID=A0AAV7VSC6_PLEWA|nr:hypothetical protein NDU88_007276 [Pleurodeles waltl]
MGSARQEAPATHRMQQRHQAPPDRKAAPRLQAPNDRILPYGRCRPTSIPIQQRQQEISSSTAGSVLKGREKHLQPRPKPHLQAAPEVTGKPAHGTLRWWKQGHRHRSPVQALPLQAAV